MNTSGNNTGNLDESANRRKAGGLNAPSESPELGLPVTVRNRSLDVLRGIAILLVIASHYGYFAFMEAGWIGVDLFFVLSGFLISGLLFAELKSRGRISLGRFFIRRGLKIYPPVYFFLGLTALLFPNFRQYLLREVLFLQNYWMLPWTGAGAWIHLWSLAVEEHFYLVLPFVLLALYRYRRLNWVPYLSVVLIVACFWMRVSYFERTGLASIYPTHLRMDGLFAGVALGYLYHFRSEKFMQVSQWWLPFIAIPLLTPAFLTRSSPAAVSLCFTTNLVAFSLLLLWAVPRQLRGFKVVAEIGRYSYSIYLWQMPLASFCTAFTISLLHLVGYVASALTVGVAVGMIVEFPVLAFRDRLFPSRAPDDPRQQAPTFPRLLFRQRLSPRTPP